MAQRLSKDPNPFQQEDMGSQWACFLLMGSIFSSSAGKHGEDLRINAVGTIAGRKGRWGK